MIDRLTLERLKRFLDNQVSSTAALVETVQRVGGVILVLTSAEAEEKRKEFGVKWGIFFGIAEVYKISGKCPVFIDDSLFSWLIDSALFDSDIAEKRLLSDFNRGVE